MLQVLYPTCKLQVHGRKETQIDKVKVYFPKMCLKYYRELSLTKESKKFDRMTAHVNPCDLSYFQGKPYFM